MPQFIDVSVRQVYADPGTSVSVLDLDPAQDDPSFSGTMIAAMAEPAAKYEAWEAEILGQLEAYTKLRKQVRFFPLLAVLTAPIGLFWAPWAAALIVLAWLSMWATTLYITYMRTWQYKNELAITRAEVARLRASAAPAPPSRSP
jgi:hypothetical protein